MTTALALVATLVAHAAAGGAGRRSLTSVRLRAGVARTSNSSNGSGSSGNGTQTALGSVLPRDAYGDLACMRWSGGSCNLFDCSEERGPTVCQGTLCMCRPGFCADSRGVCIPQAGEWLGSHTIRFAEPTEPRQPYIAAGARPSAWREAGIEARNSGVRYALASSARPFPWKVVLTPCGHARFESEELPGHVVKIYSSRRRRSRRRRSDIALQTGLHDGAADLGADLSAGLGRGALFDDDDLWPVVVRLEDAHPLDVTFQVRQTSRDGGGLEIWDPQTQRALASADDSGWFYSDPAAEQGVAECSGSGHFGGIWRGCDGRQLVRFEPPLPERATPRVGHERITEIAQVTWWQRLLILGLAGVCFGVCYAGYTLLKQFGAGSAARAY